MIERLRGKILVKDADGAVVSVGGVGFLVEASSITMRDLPDVGEEGEVFTHLHVREDAMQLFGFSTQEERELFRLLLSVSKVGPKLALAALSARRATELKKALASGDVALLASVPGIGKKTAERIIVELREKMGDAAIALAESSTGGAGPTSDSSTLARSALVELGYSVGEAQTLLTSVDPELPVEEQVRLALGGSS